MNCGPVEIAARLGRASTGRPAFAEPAVTASAATAASERTRARTSRRVAGAPKERLRARLTLREGDDVENVRELVGPNRQAGAVLEQAPAPVAEERAERASPAGEHDPMRRPRSSAFL